MPRQQQRPKTTKTTYQGYLINRHRYVTTDSRGNRHVTYTNSFGELFIGLCKVLFVLAVIGLVLAVVLALLLGWGIGSGIDRLDGGRTHMGPAFRRGLTSVRRGVATMVPS